MAPRTSTTKGVVVNPAARRKPIGVDDTGKEVMLREGKGPRLGRLDPRDALRREIIATEVAEPFTGSDAA